MDNLFITVFEISVNGVSLIANNERIGANGIYSGTGMKLKVTDFDDCGYKMLISKENLYITVLLMPENEDCGFTGNEVCGSFYEPLLTRADGGFANVYCAYLFAITRVIIQPDNLLKSVGIDYSWRASAESVETLNKRVKTV